MTKEGKKMFPGGMNQKQMQTVMKRMGIKVEEIDAQRVIIECSDRNIIIESPQVMLTKMPNQEMFQVMGEVREEEKGASTDEEVKVDITDDDIEMVMEQAGVDKNTAEQALVDAEGDIADAIMQLKKVK